MSDQISVSFSLNSNEFVAEVQKAQKGLDGMSNNTMPDLEKRMSQAQATAKKTADSIRGMEPAAKSTGTGLLQLAYFADDAQYGMKGILNNIPGIVQGLGMGAGIAGAISLVALAANIAWPALEKLYSNKDSQAVIDAAKEYEKVLTSNLKKIQEQTVELEKQRRIAAELQGFRENKVGDLFGGAQVEVDKSRIDALQKEIAMEQQLTQARQAAEIAAARARGEDTTAMEEDFAKANAQAKLDAIQLQIEAQKKLAEDARSYAEEQSAYAEKYKTEVGGSIDEVAKKLAEAQRQMAFSEAAKAQAEMEKTAAEPSVSKTLMEGLLTNNPMQAQLQAIQDAKIAEANAAASAARFEKDKQLVAELQTQLEVLQKQQTVVENISGEAETAQADAAAAAKKLEEMEKQLEAQKEITRLSKEKAEADSKISNDAKDKQQSANDPARQAQEAARAEEKRKSQELSLRAVTGEILALRAQAAGQNAIAKEIRNRIALAQEAKNIAAATGLDEQKALALAREKQRLEQGLEKGAGKRANDGRIRLYKAGEAPGTLQRGEGAAARKADAFQQRTQAWMGSPQKVVTNTQDIDQAQLKVLNQIFRLWQKSIGTI
jgi:hypothetical protein